MMNSKTENLRPKANISSRSAIITSEPNGKIIYCNQAAKDWFGINKAACPSLDTLIPSVKVGQTQQTLQLKNGPQRVNVYVEEIETGLATLLQIELTPLAEHVGVSLVEYELLSLFVENAPSAIAMFDKELRYLVASRRWYEDYDIVGEDIIGKSHYEIFPEILEMPEWLDLHQRCLKGEIIKRDVDEFEREDGSKYDINCELRPWKQSDGTIGGLVMFTSVVSDFVIMQQELKKSEERLSFLFSNLRDLVCIHTADGTYLQVTESARNIVGYEPEEMLGKNPYEFFHPDDIDFISEESHKKILSGANRTQIEYRFRHKDGHYIWFDTTTELIKDEDGNISSLITSSRDVTERVNAERAASESEARFKRVFTSIDEGMVYQDDKGRITLANKSAERILGLSQDQLKGIDSFDPRWKCIHEDGSDYPGEVHPAMRCLKSGKTIRNDIMGVFHPDKEKYVWIEVSSYPIFKEDKKKASEVITTFTDISDKYEAQQELLKSEKKFRSVFDNTFSFMGLTTPDGTVIDINRIALEFGNITREQAIGSKLWEGPWWPLEKGGFNHIEEAVRSASKGQFVRYDMELTSKTGGKITIDFSLRPIKDSQGNVIWLIPEGRNITNKIAMEKSLFKLNAELFSILDSVPHALIFAKSDRVIDRINAKTTEIFGYSEKELLGSSTSIFYVDKGDFEQIHDIYDHGIANKKKIFEINALKKDGTEFVARVIRTGVYNDKNELVGYLKLIEDITEQKEIENLKEKFTQTLESQVESRTKELRQAKEALEDALETEKELNLLKTHFVSSASHQFRTPLTVIQSNAELISMFKQQVIEDKREKFGVYSDRIQTQVRKMTSLMDDLLLFGKISGGKVVPEVSTVDLEQLCSDLLDQQKQAEDSRDLISLQISGTKKELETDPKLLGYSIENLLTNALKYSPDQAPVITLKYASKYVEILVHDKGIGINKSEIKNLFQPFFRGSNVKDIQGTGLGLSIAKEYVLILNGSIDASSSKSKGTTFTIKLPYTV
ncbi:PAS domain-containing sensor histidine kinase [bacterium]|nr:PAS domain-containing sensor histidine kinase [bacterium]